MGYGWYGVQLAGVDNGTAGHDLYIQGRTHNTGAFANLMVVRANGNVGIGTTSPSAKLQVAGGQIAGALFNDPTTTANTSIDWNNGNVQTTGAAAGTVTFTNMIDGATYMLTLTNATGGSYTLAATGLTFRCNPACPVSVSANKHTVMNLVKAGNNVYVAWVKDFQ